MDSLGSSPAFRKAFERRRCLMSADNFYEWKKTATGKQRSFAVITTTPNELCAELHNRMPVILKPEAWPIWLDSSLIEPVAAA